jgi:hypothetical protein
MMMMRLSIALLAALSLAPSGSSHASCARAEFVPTVLTTRDPHLPGDGGVLVGYGYSTDHKLPEETGPDPSDVRWTAADGKKPIALTRVALAPGLSMYKPAAGTTALVISSKAGNRIGAFTVDPKAAANTLAAPQPRQVKVVTTPSFRSTTTIATLTLKAAPPPEAVAVIVYRVDATGATALGFTGLPDTHDKLTSFEVSHTGGHCSQAVAGEVSPEGGDKIAFAWVDAFGRLSPQSKPIVAK